MGLANVTGACQVPVTSRHLRPARRQDASCARTPGDPLFAWQRRDRHFRSAGHVITRRGSPALALQTRAAHPTATQAANRRHSDPAFAFGGQSGATEADVVVAVVGIVPVTVGNADVPLIIVPRAAPQDAHRHPHTSRMGWSPTPRDRHFRSAGHVRSRLTLIPVVLLIGC